VNVTSSASEWSRISSSPFGQNVEVFSVTGQVLAIELMRKSEVFKRFTVNYWRDIQKKEVDFVIKDGIRTRQLIQVTYASSKETIKDREIKNLLVASAELKCSDLLVITWDYEAEEKVKGRKIKFVPLWKWLLNI
jgi:predicted AAA+ superfamily ATPase